jgi:hypothetical protein
MPQITSSTSSKRTRNRTAAAVLLIALASLVLAACGGSSKSSSSTGTSASATTSTAGKPAGASRFAAFRECLQKNGISLPKFTPGKRPSHPGGSFGAGTPTLPKGVSKTQYEAAIKKCGGSPGGFGKGARFNSPAIKQALAKFATCMRKNGENVPAPNTSGKGPVFSTKGLNTSSSKFKEAESKCRSDLGGAFRGRPGGAGGAGGAAPAAPPGTAPPSAG